MLNYQKSGLRLVVGYNISGYRGCRGRGSGCAWLGIIDDSVVVCGVGDLDADTPAVNAGDEEVIVVA